MMDFTTVLAMFHTFPALSFILGISRDELNLTGLSPACRDESVGLPAARSANELRLACVRVISLPRSSFRQAVFNFLLL